MKQQYSSANTSINSTKIAKIFNFVDWKPQTTNLDIGGGKYDNATEFLEKKYVKNFIYDPYNRSEDHNSTILNLCICGVDTVTVANVLNVIKEESVRINVILLANKYLKPGGVAYFQIYEGNKSGIGTATKKDCWQENRKTVNYIDEIKKIFNYVESKSCFIIAIK
jgi:hypothetical protein